MKIITWNIYKDNKKLYQAIEFLKKSDFDVICLQEFPASALKKLKSVGANYVLENEYLVYNNRNKKPDKMHTVIISNIPIKKTGVIKHKDFYEELTSKADRYEYFKANSVYIDIDIGSRKLRIFNVHFKCVAGPHHRLSQLKEILKKFDPKRENIICGDLNTFGHPLINIIVWKYFGYKKKEFLINEKKMLKNTFDLNHLQNPFHGSPTFLKFPRQYDYILLPKTTKIISKYKFLSSYGSDHLPISVEI